MTNTIPCPECNSPIFFEANLLVTGSKFTCSNCGVSIGLDQKSSRTIVDATEKLNKIKKNID